MSLRKMNTHQMLTRSKATEIKESLPILTLQNNLILSEILSYLPFEHLKETRQVNRFWKDASQKYFKLRSLAKIDKDFLEEFEDYEFLEGFDDIKFHVNYYIGMQKGFKENLAEIEFQEDVSQFILSHGTNIQFLKLHLTQFIGPLKPARKDSRYVPNRAKLDFEFINIILKEVPQLKELYLIITKRQDRHVIYEFDWDEFTISEPFPNLKKLILEFSYYYSYLATTENLKLKRFFNKLLQLSPNLEILKLPQLNNEDLNSNFLKELNDYQMEWKIESNGPLPFKNLSSITFDWDSTEQVLKLLQPIKKFSIFGSEVKMDVTLLQKLLDTHAKTLERLQFKFEIGNCDLEELEVINFPNFPRLKSLKFKVTYRWSDHEDETGPFDLIKLFMLGGERFKAKIPRLQSFAWRESEGFNSKVYKRIFPHPNEDLEIVPCFCFPQFTFLNLSNIPYKFYDGDHSSVQEDDDVDGDEEYNAWMIRLAKMFPNVHNHQFNKARLLSVPQ